MERTLIIVKPDGVRKGLIGEVIRRIESQGLRLAGMKMVSAERSVVEKHYAEHKAKPFYGSVVEFLTSGPIVVMAVQGKDAIMVCRSMMGVTDPAEAGEGTIRSDYGESIQGNVIHGSADPVAAEYELPIWFEIEELI